MTVKELFKKYKGYNIMVFGRPLKEQTTPYTFLPHGAELESCLVKDMEVKEGKEEYYEFGFNGLLKKKYYKGVVKAYAVRPNETEYKITNLINNLRHIENELGKYTAEEVLGTIDRMKITDSYLVGVIYEDMTAEIESKQI